MATGDPVCGYCGKPVPCSCYHLPPVTVSGGGASFGGGMMGNPTCVFCGQQHLWTTPCNCEGAREARAGYKYPFAQEVRATDPATGGQKGRKPEEYALIPVEPLAEIARVYAYGAAKYAPRNMEKGYPWSWSFSSLMRHAWAFWRGEDRDKESGHLHLAHCAWHALTMMDFLLRKRGTDDRSV